MAKEYIERKAVIEETRKPRLSDAELRRKMTLIPSADVVKVVRCKDCKKYGTPYCAVDLWTTDITMRKATENGFCSFGERREVQDG